MEDTVFQERVYSTESQDVVSHSDGATVTAGSEEYVQVMVFRHKPTGYYYDPTTQQYLVPVSYSEQQSISIQKEQTLSVDKVGLSNSAKGPSSEKPVTAPSISTFQSEPILSQNFNDAPITSNSSTFSTDSKHNLCTSNDSEHPIAVDSDESDLNKLKALEKDFKECQNKARDQSVSSMLASVSERVMRRCGYQFEEKKGMYYQELTGLFYDQDTKLYFDPEQSCYYDYNPDTKSYFLHSQVSPVDTNAQRAKEKSKRSQPEVIDISSDSEADSPEEGEIRSPKRPYLPIGSPPPENRWTSCLRVVIINSNQLEKYSVYIVTIAGASIGREPEGANVIKVPELAVSKSHAVIGYDRAKDCFTVTDLASVNGTLLNQERLSESKKQSKPHPLSHGDTLTFGSTTLLLHIHTGLDMCEECDPVSLEEWRKESVASDCVLMKGSLDMTRRRELNRIKGKYGLRIRDTFGDQCEPNSGYKDRAEHRRKTVGSDLPNLDYPDSLPSSVDRTIESANVGHRMLLKMGWNEGSGLGKSEQGQVNPVKVQIRDSKSGLGYEYSSRDLDSGGWDSSTTLKSKLMRKRYKEVTKVLPAPL